MSPTVNPVPVSLASTRKAVLADRLRRVAKRPATWPLSSAQQRLWFLDQLEPESSLYNLASVVRLSGSLDIKALRQSLAAVVARHEILRTQFRSAEDAPMQVVNSAAALELRVEDVSGGNQNEREEKARQLIRGELKRPFNLSTDLLIRALLIRLRADGHLLMLNMHHIVSDEWSLRVLYDELSALYAGFVSGTPARLRPLPIQYADYALWQQDWLKGERLAESLQYWRKLLGGSPSATELPTDRPRGPSPTFVGASMEPLLDKTLSANVFGIAQREGVTTFMLLLASLQAFIHRYTQQEDVIVGSPIAGRNRPETEGLIGFFVNTLPLRAHIEGDPAFRNFLVQVRESTLGAYANQDVPFEKIVEALQPERSLSHLPFTKVMFVFQNRGTEVMEWAGLKVTFEDVETLTAKFDITIIARETAEGLRFRCEYNTDLFEANSIARLLANLEAFLAGIVKNPNSRLSELPLLAEQEWNKVVVEWNQTDSDYPRLKCIHEVFEAQVLKAPNATALRFGNQSLTYQELNARANQLAHSLRQYNLAPGTPVGICVDRSVEMVVGALAVLKAGGAYLALDPNYPRERLMFMLEDTGAPVLLTQQNLLSRLSCGFAKVFCLDADWDLIARESKENLFNTATPESLAYVMYTSGSTGKPKGVSVPHRAVNRLVLNTNFLQFGPNHKLAQVSNFSFDAATFEIWGALLNGGSLIGIAQDVALSPKDFARELREQGITALFLTSALFNQVVSEAPGAFETLDTVMAGGEALDPKWVRALLEHKPPKRFVNGYGPTENTTFTCCYLVTNLPASATNVPIGGPIANTQCYVLDRHLNPVPIGVPGELHAGGDGVACGYWKRPELTAQKFVPDTFRGPPGRLLYRTGDLVRWRPDGTLEFLGRIDQQVKIRGFRIELGEIETVLSQHPDIKECAVAVSGNTPRTKRLVAHVVSHSNRAPNASELRSFLEQHLPEYMVPSLFMPLKALPLTSNGKVDRKALPEPDMVRPELARNYACPRDDVERELTRIWETVLAVQPIGVEDKFFELGGHSLLAVKVIARIEKSFGKKLRVATIFQCPTISQLAAILRNETNENHLPQRSCLVEIHGEGTRPPLFLVHGAGGGMFWGYVNLSRYLGPDQPVFGFKTPGLDGGHESEQIEAMAAEYIKDMRRVQPHGPYHIGGYCFGGNVAYEMARQLEVAGEQVSLLALLNCAPPNSAYTRIPWTPIWAARLARNLVYWLKYFLSWSPSQRREFFRWKTGVVARKLRGRLGRNNAVDVGNLVDLSSYTPEQQLVWAAHIRALLAYQPSPFGGRVHLFRSPGHPLWCSFDPDYGWGELARGGVTVTVVAGAHEKILEEPCVRDLAKSLSAVLAEPTAPQSGAMADNADSAREEVIPAATRRDQAAQMQFWQEQLAGAADALDLPVDRLRAAEPCASSRHYEFVISADLCRSLSALSTRMKASPAAVFLAGYHALVHRYTGAADIVTRTTIPTEWLANEVAVRCACAGELQFDKFVERIATALASTESNSDVPFVSALRELYPHRTSSHAPGTQLAFSYGQTSCSWEGESSEPSQLLPRPDIGLRLEPRGQQIYAVIEYSPELFDEGRIVRMAGHYVAMLEHASREPGTPLSHLRLLDAAEAELVIAKWNETHAPFPNNTLWDLFAEQVARVPEREALVSEEVRLSYGELCRRAGQVADCLRATSVIQGAVVAVCLERSWEMVAALLGTLQVGAAYVPIDPAYPADRIEFMLRDSGATVILTQRKVLSALPRSDSTIICVEEVFNPGHPAEKDARRTPGPGPKPQDLAYVIYTSGSTGKPKGVALEHRNAVAFVSWARRTFSAEQLSGVLACTSICFDLSIFEVFVPLCSGGKVILAQNALALPTLPAADEVKLINTVPSAIRELLRVGGVPHGVRTVNLAGEPLSTELVDQIYARTNVSAVFDLYGPTETTTYSTYTLRRPGEPPTIGRPLENEQVYLLDAYKKPVPIGLPGEIHIGGAGVARGYLNRPELTAERFIPDPFRAGERVYRTGDLGRWRKDGVIEYLGRIDHQVKVRGFRIELGEIETALAKIPGVREAVVIAREDQPGNKRLIAYVVAEGEQAPATRELRLTLARQLPEYMIPSAFVFPKALPLTPNGKVDRKALPAPEEARPEDAAFVAPRNEIEQRLVSIWREVLGNHEIGVQDNFFELGGHSLLAIQVASRVREAFGIQLPFLAVFDSPTIEALAQVLQIGQGDGALPPVCAASAEGPWPASFVQERLWLLEEFQPGTSAYTVPAILRLTGELDVDSLQCAYEALLERHEALRSTLTYKAGVLMQEISPHTRGTFQITDLSAKAADERETACQALVERTARLPFELSAGPLIRCHLVCLEPTEHVLVLVMHHAVSDGWSLALFFTELAELYNLHRSGSKAELPKPSHRYVDYSAWQRGWMTGSVLDKELQFWRTALEGAPFAVTLPAENVEPQPGRPKAAARTAVVARPVLQDALALAQHDGASLFMVLWTALNLALSKWTKQNDLVTGTVVAGRNRLEFENILGCFMNFLPLRLKVDEECSGRELLAAARRTVLAAQAHQECPFQRIVELINPQRKQDQNPLYNIGLLLQNFPRQLFPATGLSTRQLMVASQEPLLDLQFEAVEDEQGLSLTCEYKTHLFNPSTIEALLQAIGDAVAFLAKTPDAHVSQFRLPERLAAKPMAAAEGRELETFAVAATFTAEPIEEPLSFWLRKLELPSRVRFAPYNQVFQQLLVPGSVLNSNRSGVNVLLLRLEDWFGRDNDRQPSNGRNPDDVLQQTALEFVTALKAVAGRASVPQFVFLCPPSAAVASDVARAQSVEHAELLLERELASLGGVYVVRCQEVLEMYPLAEYRDQRADELGHVPYTPEFFTALATVVARKFHSFKRAGAKVIVLDLDQTLWAGVCGEDGPTGIRLDAPRRVLQEFMLAQHRAGMLLCACSKNNEEDVLQVFAHCRQMPLRREHFTSWRLNWEPKSKNLKELASELGLGLDSFIFVDDNPVECAEVEANCPEVLVLQLPEDVERIPQFLKHCWIFDRLKVTAEDRKRADMYKQNRERELLRSQSMSLADFIGGLDLKIEISPMAEADITRVSQLTQRTNQFNFTTIRRSETDIAALARVADVLTVRVRDRFGDYGLVGVLACTAKEQALEVDTCLLSCRVLGRGVEHRMLARLGELAVEKNLSWVDIHFVRTAKNKPALDFLEGIGRPFKQKSNGTDLFRFPAGFARDVAFNPQQTEPVRQNQIATAEEGSKKGSPVRKFSRCREIALEACEIGQIHKAVESSRGGTKRLRENYTAPVSEVEKQLCELWQKLLRVERVGIHDDFFELGGHSLLAVRLFAELEKLVGRKFPLVTIFQAPTVAQLARHISKSKAAPKGSLLVPIQPHGTKPPLYLVHGAGGDVLWGYANLATQLGSDQPIYGIKSRGQAGKDEFTTLEEMAACYVGQVRQHQPKGPYFLGGYCFGGNVAYEMARQLHAAGEEVAFVALLDAAPSNAGYENMEWWKPAFSIRFARNVGYWLDDFRRLKVRDQAVFLFRKSRVLVRRLLKRRSSDGTPTVDLDEVIDVSRFPHRELALWQVHLDALVVHVDREYPGSILLLRTRGQPLFCSLADDFCWGKLVRGGVIVKQIPGSHEEIFVEPNVQVLAATLSESLAAAQRRDSVRPASTAGCRL